MAEINIPVFESAHILNRETANIAMNVDDFDYPRDAVLQVLFIESISFAVTLL